MLKAPINFTNSLKLIKINTVLYFSKRVVWIGAFSNSGGKAFSEFLCFELLNFMEAFWDFLAFSEGGGAFSGGGGAIGCEVFRS
jgi:hypothetical protein